MEIGLKIKWTAICLEESALTLLKRKILIASNIGHK